MATLLLDKTKSSSQREKTVAVAEIFGPTVQGEGPYTGEPTIFIRTGGCDFRCTWCDSMHAVDPANASKWSKMTASEILGTCDTLWQGDTEDPCSLTLSGGNPAMWQGLKGVVENWNGPVRIETQGTLYQDWMDLLDTIIVSPKPPSSEMVGDMVLDQFMVRARASGAEIIFKTPCMNVEDIEWALDTHETYGREFPLYLTPVNDTSRPFNTEDILATWREIVRYINEEKKVHRNIFIGSQMHVIAWGDITGV